jgi:hypothetical protein
MVRISLLLPLTRAKGGKHTPMTSVDRCFR